MKIFLVVFIGVALTACNQGEKTGYIDINQVYSDINITKKYNEHLAALEIALTRKITINREKRSALKDEILAKKSPSQKDLQTVFAITSEMDSIEQYYSKTFKDSSEKYNLMVEKSVNDLVYQYGLKHKYTYLYSPASSNSFMYADSSLDITSAVIKFINRETK